MITFGYVSKSHGADGASAVENLSLTVRHGEFLVLIGVSGCGKTTTPNMINRLIAPIAGTPRPEGGNIAAPEAVQPHRNICYLSDKIGVLTVKRTSSSPHLSA
jgi:osmoprotectant transport system ATP-binding protein